jgi:2-methylcitrate dehydratase PrpD
VDTLGCALAGTRSAIGHQLLQHLRDVGGTGSSHVFDGGPPMAMLDAVMANGTLSHAVDFDDTNHPLYGHPSCVLMPAVLGAAERTDATGSDLVTAYLVGHEVLIALARAINHDHYGQGFHATGSLGVFASAAAAANLLRLDADRAAHTLALAASMSTGLRANIGSMTKPFHAGQAASYGVRAALMAGAGWESSLDAFERPTTGYFAAYAVGREPSIGEALDPLGTWAIEEPFGQQVKPFPACGATHPASEAALTVHRRLGGRYDRIAAIDVGVCSLLPGILVYPEPVTSDQARFSLHYTVSRALVSGRVGLDHFEGDAIHDPDVRRVMPLVRMHVDDRVRDNTEFGVILNVTTVDGEHIEEHLEFALGKNARPMSEEQLQQKFAGCLRQDVAACADLFQAWRGVDDQPSAKALWDSLDAWRDSSS